MNGISDAGCWLVFCVAGLIFFLVNGIFTLLYDLFTSPLLYFFIAVQVIAYFIGRWKKNRNHLGS